MQIKKSKIGKVFEKLKLDVRSTKHLKLTQKDFRNLIDCPLSLEDYQTILKEKGMIQIPK
jgi:hypothetical protein